MNRTFFFLILFSGIYTSSRAQDTLPRFSVNNVGNNRIILGWVNAYPVIKQISIQRSHDSLINFKTILSVADPTAVQNGFADTRAPNDHMYYRLFVNLDKGQFFITPSRRPVRDTSRVAETEEKPVITNKDEGSLKKGETFVPSFYIYTNRDGYVFVNLPDADQKKYNIKFFEEDNSLLFELKSIKERALTLDKANFYHAGWFKFELYNDEKLIERHRFYIGKDFSP